MSISGCAAGSQAGLARCAELARPGGRVVLEIDTDRNLEPAFMPEETKSLIDTPWHKKTTDGLGTRAAGIQRSFEMETETLRPGQAPISA